MRNREKGTKMSDIISKITKEKKETINSEEKKKKY